MAAFLDSMSDDLREHFARAGLIEESTDITNAELWDRYIRKAEKTVKASTVSTYDLAEKRFLRFFDPDGDPNEITAEHGTEFREWLVDEEYAEATIAATIAKTRTVFGWGVKCEFLRRNIFLDVKRGSYENKTREHYITPDAYRLLLEESPSQTWRTFIALLRIGGLRWSEAVGLKWGNVNFERGIMKVELSKTEHHVGHESRLVPLFPELREELDKLDAIAKPGEVYVLDELADSSCQVLSHQFERIIFQTGLQRWPRIFHNLRGSRSNELFRRFSVFDASYWMGQSEKVAQKHYINSSNPEIIETALSSRLDEVKGIDAHETHKDDLEAVKTE